MPRTSFFRMLLVASCFVASSLALGLDGDFNEDGAVDIRDLIGLQQHLKGEATLSGDAFTRADVAPLGDSTRSPGDGVLDAADMILHLRTLHGDDVDADGLTLSCEIASGTSPFDSDSDNDSVEDGSEDPDQDGVGNAEECARATDPHVSDRIEMGDFWLGLANNGSSREVVWDPVLGAVAYRVHLVTLTEGEFPAIAKYEVFDVDGASTRVGSNMDGKFGGKNQYVFVQAIGADGRASEFVSCTAAGLNDPSFTDRWLNVGAASTYVTTLPFDVVQHGGGEIELSWPDKMIPTSGFPTNQPASGFVVYQAGSRRPMREFDRPTGDAGGWRIVTTIASPDPENPTTSITLTNLANGVYTFRVIPYWGTAPSALPVNEEYQPATGYFQKVVAITDSTFSGVDLDVVQVEVGENYACARKSDDSTVCWGEAASPGAAPSGFYKDVSVGKDLACGVRSADNALECWGATSHAAYVPPSGAFASVEVGGQAACALRQNETVACWGVVVSPSAAQHYRSIAVGDDFVCGVRSSGQAIGISEETGGLDCWGGANWQAKLANGIPSGSAYSEVVVNWGSVEALICARAFLTGIVDCGAGTPESGQYRKYDLGMLGRCSIVFAGYTASCGREEVLYYEDRVRLESDGSRGYESIAAGLHMACGVTSANGASHLRVNCWGYFDEPIPTDWRVAGTGLAFPVASDPLPKLRDVPGQLVSGGSFSCEYLGGWTDGDADIRCWGNNTYGQATPPVDGDWPDGPGYSIMYAGKDFACGENYSSTIECWGRDNAGQVSGLPTILRDEFTYPSLIAGNDYVCAIKSNAEGAFDPVCWGNIAQPPLNFSWPSSISGGANHVCALQDYVYEYQYGSSGASLSTIFCWGDNANGQLNVPAPLGSVPAEWALVASGTRFNCGVRHNNVYVDYETGFEYGSQRPLECWGDTSNQQLAVPSYLYVSFYNQPNTPEISRIQLGDGYGCALKQNGLAPYWKCWGTYKPTGFPDSAAGQYINGELRYSNFSFGDRHICAIDEQDPEKDVVCWSHNTAPVVSPPSRTTLP